MDQYIGKLLDNRYEILDVIGIGGMAVVYKAYCHRLHRYVAIKMLKNDLAADEEFRRRFHAEAKAVAMLSHPNIVAVYDVSRGEDQDYIVMELIDGINLKQYMKSKNGPLNWRESLHFITQIVRALSHAHGRGIIHRDIKPQNIMVLRDGSVKVADFGIARVVSAAQNTLTQEALGSVHYISPEQARGSHIDARADLYSAGVVLYEMLTGRLPFEGDSPVSVAIQHISSIPLSPRELNEDIPEALEAITLRAMASRVERRYENAEEMLQDLESFRKNPQINFEYSFQDAEEIDEPTQILDTTGSLGLGRKSLSKTNRTRLSNLLEENEYEDYNYSIKSDRRGNVSKLSVLSVVLIFLIGVGAFLWVSFFSNLFQTVPEQEVPKLVGKTIQEIKEDSEFTSKFILTEKTEYNDQYEKGTVFEQDPDAKSLVKGEKPNITVKISGGKEYVMMPDVSNKPYQEALQSLKALGLEVATPEYESSDTVTKGNVISFTPLKETQVCPGETVNLVISLGPQKRTVTVPPFKELTLEEARKMIVDLKLELVNVSEITDPAPVGTVIFQSIPAGTEVEEGKGISLQVSKGNETSKQEITKSVEVTLPTDRETVFVQIAVDGVVQYEKEANPVSETMLNPQLKGNGLQVVTVYFDGEEVEQFELDFNE